MCGRVALCLYGFGGRTCVRFGVAHNDHYVKLSDLVVFRVILVGYGFARLVFVRLVRLVGCVVGRCWLLGLRWRFLGLMSGERF